MYHVCWDRVHVHDVPRISEYWLKSLQIEPEGSVSLSLYSFYCVLYSIVVRSENAVTAHFTIEQLLPFRF